MWQMPSAKFSISSAEATNTIDETMPWALAKDEAQKARLETVLYNLVEAITIGASLLESFMPETSAKILAQLQTTKRSLEEMNTFGLYPSGGKVTEKPEILFARMDLSEVMEKVEAMRAAEAGSEEEKTEESVIDIEAKPEIEYDDFAKLQFQVGEIIACEEVKKSKKLLLFPGEDRKPGETDRQRDQRTLYGRRNGWQESYGCCQSETGKTGRCSVRRYAVMCRRCRR